MQELDISTIVRTLKASFSSFVLNLHRSRYEVRELKKGAKYRTIQ